VPDRFATVSRPSDGRGLRSAAVIWRSCVIVEIGMHYSWTRRELKRPWPVAVCSPNYCRNIAMTWVIMRATERCDAGANAMSPARVMEYLAQIAPPSSSTKQTPILSPEMSLTRGVAIINNYQQAGYLLDSGDPNI
jgi:hypothetical protein